MTWEEYKAAEWEHVRELEEEERRGGWVIYKTLDGQLDYLPEHKWDSWVKGMVERKMREVSRGHTCADVLNLIELSKE